MFSFSICVLNTLTEQIHRNPLANESYVVCSQYVTVFNKSAKKTFIKNQWVNHLATTRKPERPSVIRPEWLPLPVWVCVVDKSRKKNWLFVLLYCFWPGGFNTLLNCNLYLSSLVFWIACQNTTHTGYLIHIKYL